LIKAWGGTIKKPVVEQPPVELPGEEGFFTNLLN